MSSRIDITQRLHGIDALRGIAMLLGILLHATIAYKVQPLPNWPHDAANTHWLFDYLYFIVHSFRMPLFFLIAGYFCRFLYYRAGEKDFIIHRAKRILVPFILSLVFILPFTIFPFLVYRYSYLGSRDEILEASWRQLFSWNGMAHLWFLYFLLIYYFFVIVLMRLRNTGIIRPLSVFISKQSGKFRIDNFISALITILPLALILLLVPELFLHVDTGIIPGLPYLAFFGYFFFLGWLVNRNAASSFSWMAEKTWIFLTAGIILSIFLFRVEFSGQYKGLDTVQKAGIKLLAATQVIALVLGSIGFFLRFWKSESAVWKYLSDASYWMYLIHLAIVATGHILLMSVPLNGFLKFFLILASAMVITLVTYHFFVRYTIIGDWLHGRRKKHSVPQ